MFGLFGKRQKEAVTDRVWLSEAAKWAACRQQALVQPQTLFVTWFEESFQKLEQDFAAHNLPSANILMARQLNSHSSDPSLIVFAEHYPLRNKEEELWQRCSITNAVVYSALDEPLFKYFGSDKIISMARSFGMKEEEAIEHKMITSSIKNAQDKIAAKVFIEQAATSQAEWLQKNKVDQIS